MANRYGYGIENQGYPTGRAPFALDLYSPTAALTQQMIGLKMKEFDLKKGLIDESSRRVLKALDFETIKGLGQETQKKHLQRLSEFEEKWSEEYANAETPGILPATKLQEMEFEKKSIEQDMATMRSNVEEFREVQKMVLEDLEQYQKTGLSTFDLAQTMQNIGDYEQFVGTPGRSPMQMLVARQKPVGEVINTEYGNLIDDHSKRFFDRKVDRVENGYVYFEDGNRKHMKELQGAIMRDIALKGGLQALGQKFSMEQIQNAVQARIDLTTGTKATVQQKYERVTRATKDYTKNVHDLNVFLEGVRKRNTAQLETLKNKIGADAVVYNDANNSLEFFDAPEQGKEKRIASVKLPDADASAEEIRQWKIGLNSKYPLLKGEESPHDITTRIEGDYGDRAQLGEITEPEPMTVTSLNKAASYTQDEWENETPEDQKSRVEKTAKALQRHVPEGTTISTDTSGRRRRIIVTDAEGNETIYKLDKEKGGRGYKGRQEFGEFLQAIKKTEEKPAELSPGSLDDL